jgi:HD-GYP domain-containing protein (c-di-GMP phosphodiesterase class II)
MEELLRNAGSQLDPRLVQTLIEVVQSERVQAGEEAADQTAPTAVDVSSPAPA